MKKIIVIFFILINKSFLYSQCPTIEKVEYFPAPTIVGNETYFFKYNSINGNQLWKGDLNQENSILVKNMGGADNGSSIPDNFVNLNGIVFFTATDNTHGMELWKSDGTESGTTIVKDIFPGVNSALRSGFNLPVKAGNLIFFMANDGGPTGEELWKSDGTEMGTVMVKNINDRYTGSSGSSTPQNLTDVNGTLYFKASNGYSSELWKSDGTLEGTLMLRVSLDYQLDPIGLTNVNGTLFFYGNAGPLHGYELMKSNGEVSNTVMVKDLAPGTTGSNISHYTFYNHNGILYFTLSDSSGEELWRSDGTSGGTYRVKDIMPGSVSSYPRQFTSVGSTMFFTAAINNTGIIASNVLWKTDGTEAGTIMVKNIRVFFTSSLGPKNMIEYNGLLYFTGGDAYGNPQNLWKSDGTDVGTIEIVDSENSKIIGKNLIKNNSLLYFLGIKNNATGLWRTDGAASGTFKVANINPLNNFNFISVNNKLFFANSHLLSGNELWVSDGTKLGTHLVKNINTNFIKDEYINTASLNNTFVFTLLDEYQKRKFYKSDGTFSGTGLLSEDIYYPTDYTTYLLEFKVVGNNLFFGAFDYLTEDFEFYKTDGTNTGTQLVKDIFPGNTLVWPYTQKNYSAPHNFTNYNGFVYFIAYYKPDANFTYALWKSDGTEAGTVMIKHLGNSYSKIEICNNYMYFSAGKYPEGIELWKSDGTS